MKLLKHKYFNIIWTALRIWLGYQWISAGLEKVTGGGWIGSTAGAGITGFLKAALVKATGAHPAVQSWYADFIKNIALPNAVTFSYLVAFGELLVGISLILGALTVVGLIAGALMNLNYMLAGTTSTNPNMYTSAFILLFVGVNAYTIGLDHFILPIIKKVFNKKSNSDLISS
ncbi:DoxX family membrane protein [Clostridium estertheticum]|uniref:Crp/Fnr family transcriptional regulator n=1 Tax=Clostridium estertheticum subsp. estertheticum TaxID=1552 RepID=A0A1J0GDP7_9CLOT|nr:DoxX family membrane protein [Clostridium estertheticum]APC39022.1 Crp/Fnr family transcriptional regulator [Clostridium estertheticum subsp. estertheticum]MBU3173748.1 DoxX family membrane protein [Clostridium estertheticum]MBZ9615020.1 DoxX family membrane protein [Clostridium estertheticum subsp. laramiense]WAG74923.1 DoxX family membrane protein [Clostridium estertheticum]